MFHKYSSHLWGLPSRGLWITHATLTCEGVQDMPPPNMPLWYIDYFELKSLEKQQMLRGAFSDSPYLPKDTSSERNSVVLNLLLVSSTREDWLLTTGGGISSPHMQTNFVTHSPPICFSKGPFIFPRTHFPSPEFLVPTSCLPLPY